MLRRIVLYVGVCTLLAASLIACEVITGPNFPNEPKISFQSVNKFRVKDKLGNATDSISIAIKFQDGDGNLGIAAEEIGQPPFEKEDKLPDGTIVPNPLYYNYNLKGFRRTNGESVSVDFTPTLSGQFPLLNEGKEGPIEGTLSYGSLFPLLLRPVNDTLKFEIYIYNRKGNRSNTIETSEVIINEK